jgi:phosphatidylinositol alpha-1,6-mannosyltransferase
VRFLGFVPDDDLPALYNLADLFVMASRRHELLVEGFGISLLEASSCGLAVIGGRTGGVPEAVHDGETGLLVDPDDPSVVAERIKELLGNPELRTRMGAAGRHAVERYYNWDRVARDFMSIDSEFRLG